MKPKTLLNTDIKPEAVKAPIAHKELNLNIKTEDDFFITSKEISNFLKLSHSQFNTWIAEGRFAGIRMLKRGKHEPYKFVKADFMEWLNKEAFVSA